MVSRGTRVALVSMHTSPTARAGTVDAGGMNTYILAIATELAARGVEVDLLTRATGAPAVHAVADGVTLCELRAGPPGPLAKDELVAVTDEFGEAVAELAGRGGPGYDVIHAHYWLSGLATLPVAFELGLPFVQSFHTVAAMKNASLAPGQQPEPEMRLRTEAYLANQAGAVVAGSAAEVTTLIDSLRMPPERAWVIPPGVDIAHFRPGRAAVADSRMRARYGIDAASPIVTVAGRIQPLKGLELAIDAIAELGAAGRWSPVLIVAGESTPGEDPYLQSLRQRAARLGIDGRVRFVGALGREDLADLLAASSITLVPSHSETFGLVALESAASGTPVIAQRGSGLTDSVADGLSGVLVASREPRDWAAAVSRVLDDEATGLGWSARSRLYAEGFTWGSTGTALLGLYASLGQVRL